MRPAFFLLINLIAVGCTTFSEVDPDDTPPTRRFSTGGAGGQAQGGSTTAGEGGSGQSGNAGSLQGGNPQGGNAQGGGGNPQGGSTTAGSGGTKAGAGNGGSGAGAGGSDAGAGGSTTAGAGGSDAGTGGSTTAGAGGQAQGGSAPVGWQGPFRVAQVALGNEPEGFLNCGSGQGMLYVANVKGTTSCAPCSCGEMPASCEHGGLELWQGQDSCNGVGVLIFGEQWNNGCFDFTASSNGKIAGRTLPAKVVAGACPASGGALQPTKITGQEFRLCGGQPTAGERACILGPPGGSCPQEWPYAQAVAKNFQNQFKCETCSCDATTPPECEESKVQLQFVPNCGPDFGPLPGFKSSCNYLTHSVAAGDHWSVNTIAVKVKTKGSCTPKGGVLLGGISLQEPATLCCATP